MNNFKIVGSKGVLVKLEPLAEFKVSASGVYEAAYDNYVTDGGRPASQLSSERFSLVGEIVQVSDKAMEIAKDLKMDLAPGVKVMIQPNAKHSSNHFYKPEDRLLPVAEYEGYLIVLPESIQAILS